MENSESNPAGEPSGARHMAIAVRAMISAGVFGTLGYFLGRWLGIRGNAENRQMAEPIMKWGMAGFAAVLAAYSSLKASEHPLQEDMEPPAVPEQKAGSRTATMKDGPNLQANEAVHEGKMAETKKKSLA